MPSIPTITLVYPDGKVESHRLDTLPVTIGRAQDNIIVSDDPSLSNYHAQIFHDGENYILRDLETTNGTHFQGRAIESMALNPGWDAYVGAIRLIFEIPGVESVPLPDLDSSLIVPINSTHRPPPPSPGSEGFPASDSFSDASSDATYDAPLSADSQPPASTGPKPFTPQTQTPARKAPVTISQKSGKKAPSKRNFDKLGRTKGEKIFAAIIFIVGILLAPLVGLHIHHFKETNGGILVTDIMSSRDMDNPRPRSTSPAKEKTPADDPAESADTDEAESDEAESDEAEEAEEAEADDPEEIFDF